MSQDMELLLPVSGRGSLPAFVLMCNERMMNNYRQITQNPHQGWGCRDMYLHTAFIQRETGRSAHTHRGTRKIHQA